MGMIMAIIIIIMIMGIMLVNMLEKWVGGGLHGDNRRPDRLPAWGSFALALPARLVAVL